MVKKYLIVFLLFLVSAFHTGAKHFNEIVADYPKIARLSGANKDRLTVDLHGYSTKDVEYPVIDILNAMLEDESVGRVNFITGRGNHTEESKMIDGMCPLQRATLDLTNKFIKSNGDNELFSVCIHRFNPGVVVVESTKWTMECKRRLEELPEDQKRLIVKRREWFSTVFGSYWSIPERPLGKLEVVPTMKDTSKKRDECVAPCDTRYVLDVNASFDDCYNAILEKTSEDLQSVQWEEAEKYYVALYNWFTHECYDSDENSFREERRLDFRHAFEWVLNKVAPKQYMCENKEGIIFNYYRFRALFEKNYADGAQFSVGDGDCHCKLSQDATLKILAFLRIYLQSNYGIQFYEWIDSAQQKSINFYPEVDISELEASLNGDMSECKLDDPTASYYQECLDAVMAKVAEGGSKSIDLSILDLEAYGKGNFSGWNKQVLFDLFNSEEDRKGQNNQQLIKALQWIMRKCGQQVGYAEIQWYPNGGKRGREATRRGVRKKELEHLFGRHRWGDDGLHRIIDAICYYRHIEDRTVLKFKCYNDKYTESSSCNDIHKCIIIAFLRTYLQRKYGIPFYDWVDDEPCRAYLRPILKRKNQEFGNVKWEEAEKHHVALYNWLTHECHDSDENSVRVKQMSEFRRNFEWLFNKLMYQHLFWGENICLRFCASDHSKSYEICIKNMDRKNWDIPVEITKCLFEALFKKECTVCAEAIYDGSQTSNISTKIFEILVFLRVYLQSNYGIQFYDWTDIAQQKSIDFYPKINISDLEASFSRDKSDCTLDSTVLDYQKCFDVVMGQVKNEDLNSLDLKTTPDILAKQKSDMISFFRIKNEIAGQELIDAFQWIMRESCQKFDPKQELGMQWYLKGKMNSGIQIKNWDILLKSWQSHNWEKSGLERLMDAICYYQHYTDNNTLEFRYGRKRNKLTLDENKKGIIIAFLRTYMQRKYGFKFYDWI